MYKNISLTFFFLSLSLLLTGGLYGQNTQGKTPPGQAGTRDNKELLGDVFVQPTFEGIEKIAAEDSLIDKLHIKNTPDSVIAARMALLDARSPFQLMYNDEVKGYINMYLARRPEQVARMAGLADYYYPIFEQALDSENLPLEFKNLSVIESALNPKARSRVGASGLWQLMLGTGRMFDLHTDSYVDERFDPKKSSDAAAKFLKQLYNMYGDWNLALAAYNYGPGNVNKAISRSGGRRNYWEIRSYMPRETQNYVAIFIAANYVMTYYKEHGIIPEVAPIESVATDTIHIKQMLSFDFIAPKLDMSKEELQFLNPSYKLDVVPAPTAAAQHVLTLPADKAQLFAGLEDGIYAEAKEQKEKLEKELKTKVAAVPAVVTYKVRRGDTLGGIAQRYKVSISQLKKWNSLKSNTIRIGQRLLIHRK